LSSRRRHTGFSRDWSSDVCSSDLINYGCTPTKTMVASARVAHLAQRAADYGVNNRDVSVNMEVVRHRKRQIVENFRSSGRRRIEIGRASRRRRGGGPGGATSANNT